MRLISVLGLFVLSVAACTQVATPLKTDSSTTTKAASQLHLPMLTVGSSAGAPGEQVQIALSFLNSTGIQVTSLSADIAFDDAALEIIDAKPGPDLLPGYQLLSGKSASNLLRLGVISFSAPKTIKDGVIATVNFRVKPEAKIGNTKVTLKPGASDARGNFVAISGSNGLVQIMPQELKKNP
ncbi:MAG: hypothetical protein HY888_08360 [Deltaproteobacteria bacterium]|nr:hypothetical protein [Deltaproteobacteria bacterium]